MPQYNSTDKRTQTIGIAGYTENDTVLTTIGNSTFQGNVFLGNGDATVFGDGGDLRIFSSGFNSFIQETSATGNLYIDSTNLVLRNGAANETLASFLTNGAVDLYYDNALKFSTTTTGINVTGLTDTDTLNVSGDSTFQGNVFLGDTDILNFGVGNDLQIFHDGFNSIIRDVGTGNLDIRGANAINLQNNTAAETYAIFNNNGSVDLYYDNALKFSTTSTGSDVTGTLRASTSLVTTTDGSGITITNNTISGPSTITIDPSAVGDNTGTVVIAGDLQVDGTTTTVNSTTITVDDKNIELGSVATPSDTTADSGGITLKGATDKTFNWINSTGSWTSSENIDIATGKTYKINATDVLSADTLGSGVVNSSLTSVGTIGTGVWQGTAINDDYIGTIDNANKVALSSLDIDGGTAIAALTADDLFIIDDGASGTNRSITAANAKTYFASDVSSINLANETNDTATFLTFSPDATGEQALKTNANLTFNASTGALSASTLVSNVAQGTAPLTVTSNTLVTNLNADLLDSQEGSFYRNASNINAGTLAIAYGGTNGSATPTLGGAAYGTGTAYAFTAAGTAGQVLTSNGAAAPTWGDVVPQIIAADESADTTCFPLFATTDTGAISIKTDASGLRYNSSSETLDINNINVVTNATVKGAIRCENVASTERFEISYNETTDSLDFSYFAS